MAFEDRIEVLPEETIAKGNRIKALFDSFTEKKKELYTVADKVAASWIGADSASYISSIRGYEADFVKLGSAIEALAADITNQGRKYADKRDRIKAAASRL